MASRQTEETIWLERKQEEGQGYCKTQSTRHRLSLRCSSHQTFPIKDLQGCPDLQSPPVQPGIVFPCQQGGKGRGRRLIDKRLGPECTDSRSMDKLYICLIPFIYLPRMTLTILSLAFYLMPHISTIGRVFRNSAPWAEIIILQTITLSIPIPKLLEILPTFMVLYLAMFLGPTPSTIGGTGQNGAKWIAIFSIHPILVSISALRSLNKIQILQTALNILMQLSLVWLCLHWPRFYYSLKRNRTDDPFGK